MDDIYHWLKKDLETLRMGENRQEFLQTICGKRMGLTNKWGENNEAVQFYKKLMEFYK